jgi:hypothetical protein
MPDTTQAMARIHALASERRARGASIPDDRVRRATALLLDLWTAAERHGLTPADPGYSLHLPRAALDAVASGGRRRNR